MDIKHQLLCILRRVNLTEVPNNGFYVSDDKIDNISFDEFESELLTYYYNKYHGNINKIADKLKISNRTLYRKFKLYGLKNGKAALNYYTYCPLFFYACTGGDHRFMQLQL